MQDPQTQAALNRARARVAALRRQQLALALQGDVHGANHVARQLRRGHDGQWDWQHLLDSEAPAEPEDMPLLCA